MSLIILYEDNHLLCIQKPAHLPTQPSKEHEDSLETRAKDFLKKKYQKKGEVFLHAIHRLDKEVAGIVIFAKTSKALSRMQEMVREKKIVKIYHAHVEGVFPDYEGTLENYLLKQEHYTSIVEKKHPLGKKAILTYKLLSKNKQFSTLEIQLETGRYHQIRAQLAHRGFPILGDTKYGSHIRDPEGAIALKHVMCSFVHPVKQTSIELKAFF